MPAFKVGGDKHRAVLIMGQNLKEHYKTKQQCNAPDSSEDVSSTKYYDSQEYSRRKT